MEWQRTLSRHCLSWVDGLAIVLDSKVIVDLGKDIWWRLRLRETRHAQKDLNSQGIRQHIEEGNK
jgi:hypothetical protein